MVCFEPLTLETFAYKTRFHSPIIESLGYKTWSCKAINAVIEEGGGWSIEPASDRGLRKVNEYRDCDDNIRRDKTDIAQNTRSAAPLAGKMLVVERPRRDDIIWKAQGEAADICVMEVFKWMERGSAPSRGGRGYDRGDRKDSLWNGGVGRQVPVGLSGGGHGDDGGGADEQSGRKDFGDGTRGGGGGDDDKHDGNDRAGDNDDAVADVDGSEHSIPTSTSPSSGAWSPQDDTQLRNARANGKNWSEIQSTHFQSKTRNACRKRHERLIMRENELE